MASPPALANGDIESWGPDAQPNQVRVQRIVDLIAAQLDVAVDIAADMLLSLAGRHRYLLLAQLACSPHAVVYVAIDQMLAREVALKIHLESLTDNGKWNAFAEARMQVSFDHPHVVRVLDVGEHDGLFYTVTELCDADMKAWARGKPWRVVLRRIVEAGRGLGALHRANLVHCDVKPANILIKNEVAKVGDFGLSARAGLSAQVAGTPGYIAPEVAAGFRTPAADVFALAVSAWVCLFGALPFALPVKVELGDKAGVMMALIEQAREGRLVEPPQDSAVPTEVVAIIRAGLRAVPQQRATLEGWLRRVERVCGDAAKPERRWLPAFAAGVAAGGVSAALVTVAVMSPGEPPEVPEIGESTSAPMSETGWPEMEALPSQLALPPDFISYAKRKDSGAEISMGELRSLADELIREAEAPDSASPVSNAILARAVASDLKRLAVAKDRHELVAYADELLQRAANIMTPNR